MKENALAFGAPTSVVGVLTRAEQERIAGRRPAVLLLNAGRLHRVGPNRIYVRIARELASAGFHALRFDFSGIGDSEIRRDELSVDESTLRECKEAMDQLTATVGADRFVLIGLCEGARNAFRIARADPRVVGVFMIDGYAYRTVGFYWRHWIYLFVRQATRARARLAALLSGRRRGVVPGSGSSPGAPDEIEQDDPFPPKEDLLADIQELLRRGAQLYFVYTSGGMEGFYNHEPQFFDVFPSLRGSPQIRLKYMPATDHTFTLARHQEELRATVTGWANEVLVRLDGRPSA